MFVGHYAVSLALKSKGKKASLGLLFLAVQFLDILFFPLVVFGIERLRLVDHFTDATNFVLEYMPYSHSLVAAFVWAGVTFVAFRVHAGGMRVPLIMAVAVVSHWFLDLIVHTPDLPILYGEGPLVGLGLWNNAVLTFIVEAVLLLIGLGMYMRATHARSAIGTYGMPVLVVALMGINAVNLFAPPTGNTIPAVAATALMLYLALAAIAFWLDRHRG